MLNRIECIGNVGTEPEMKYTPNGSPVTTFRLATNHSYTRGDGEKVSETEWFTVVAWNKTAELVSEYVTKGGRVFVEGRLKSNNWTAQDGSQRFSNEIVASRVLFLDRRESNGDAPLDANSDELPW